MVDESRFDFETNIEYRLEAMAEVPNADDVSFLVAAVRHFKRRAVSKHEAELIAELLDWTFSEGQAKRVAIDLVARLCTVTGATFPSWIQ